MCLIRAEPILSILHPFVQDFVGLVSEYIHGVAHDDNEAQPVRTLASKTWSALKRSAKAGPRRTVCASCACFAGSCFKYQVPAKEDLGSGFSTRHKAWLVSCCYQSMHSHCRSAAMCLSGSLTNQSMHSS